MSTIPCHRDSWLTSSSVVEVHGFDDSKNIPIDLHRLTDADLTTKDYDYDSDSDLEDGDGDEDESSPLAQHEAGGHSSAEDSARKAVAYVRLF